MKSISFNIRVLTWVLIGFLVLMVLSRILHGILFIEEVRGYKLLGVEISDKLNPNVFRILTLFYCLLLGYIVFQLKKFSDVMNDFYDDLFFSSKNGVQLKKIANGILFFTILIGVLKLYLELYSISSSDPSEMLIQENGFRKGPAFSAGYLFGQILAKISFICIPLFIISQILSLLSELVKKGYLLKSENDLTI